MQEIPEQVLQRRLDYAATEEGARLIDAFIFVPQHLKPSLFELMECFGRWYDV